MWKTFPGFPDAAGCPLLSLCVVGITLTVPNVLARQNRPEFAAQDATGAPGNASNAATSGRDTEQDGAAVLRQARARLDEHTTIQARLLETVAFGHRRFRALGQYVQGPNGQLRVSLEFVPQDADQSEAASGQDQQSNDSSGTSSQRRTAAKRRKKRRDDRSMMLQVSDGQILWTLWQTGDEPHVTRRDIQEIVRAAEGNERIPDHQLLASLGVGGIKALLAALQESIQFTAAAETTVDDEPFVVIQGKWNERNRALLARGQDSERPLPAYVPDYVRIYLDRDTLFPRRLLYLKRHPTEKKVRPLVSLDLSEIVLNGDVDPKLFRFVAPDGVKPEDETQQYIERIRQIAEGQAAAAK